MGRPHTMAAPRSVLMKLREHRPASISGARQLALAVLCLLSMVLFACASSPRVHAPDLVLSTAVHRVVPCLGPDSGPVELERDQDLVVLVHGCNSSIAKFKNLAEVFQSRGQRAVCFTYDDRDSLVSVARELQTALAALEPQLGTGQVTVIGHSQGGLIARQAVAKQGDFSPKVSELVTISTPFAGIHSAHDCGLLPLHIFTFGITVGVCQAIAGRKWTEIHDRAPFVRSPPPLAPKVERHLAIISDEMGACRTRDEQGRCTELDAVFTVQEQALDYVAGPRVQSKIVRAGHAQIVGEEGVVPFALISLLEAEQVLMRAPLGPSQTSLAKAQDLARIYRAHALKHAIAQALQL